MSLLPDIQDGKIIFHIEQEKPNRHKQVKAYFKRDKPDSRESQFSCKECGSQFERRSHRTITARQLAKPFYYSEWDYCNPKTGGCGHLEHYEEFKVWNTNRKSSVVRLYEEKQRNQDFLNQI